MGMPQPVVTAVLIEGRARSEVARDYGLSRRWMITLVQRFRARASRGSHRGPTAPQQPGPNRDGGRGRIVAIRKGLDRHGHEAGRSPSPAHSARRHGTSPAPAR
jgi:hypothetical protein